AVFSTAVEKDKPEVIKAAQLGIPAKTRPEYLAEIVEQFSTIAVAGTSGKSTASGMLAYLSKRLGLKPNFIGGGRVKDFRSQVNPGNYIAGDSDSLIIEACESDGTIVNYRPRHSIILNLGLDHNPVDKTAGMFRVFMANTTGTKIVNADDEELMKIDLGRVVTFSIDNPSDYKAEAVRYGTLGTEFRLRNTGFRISLPGKYNLYNALSCISLLHETGTSLDQIAALLPEFRGIERRFDIHLNDERGIVIDDYAHNPDKISAFMSAMKQLGDGICYIFQPHGFGPTRLMKKGYIETFVKNLRDTDHLFLLPIFYSGGTAAKDISSNDLAEGIRSAGRSVEVIEDRRTVLERIGQWRIYTVFGARDESLSSYAEEIAGALKQRRA
ncbi:MAG: Mur ligase family protein, partial [Nitrospirota bacterium]|nr:Mur ligase family protein [Nitrospirota bacterium]